TRRPRRPASAGYREEHECHRIMEQLIRDYLRSTRRTGMRGFGRIYRRRATWWVEYWHRGRQFRESSGSVRETDAERLLKRRLQEIGRGRFIGPTEERVLFTELLDGLLADYKLNGRRSLGTVQYYVAVLRSAFSGERAIDVTEDRI